MGDVGDLSTSAIAGRGRTGTVGVIPVRSNPGGLRSSLGPVEDLRDREVFVSDMVGLSTEGIGENGAVIGKAVGSAAPSFGRGPNLALRFGLPKATVNCLTG